MNSHFQSRETAWISSGGVLDSNGFAGSSSCDPIQATPPSSVITSSGMAQTISLMRPEYSQSGKCTALALEARNHQAKANVAAIVGTTIASMIARESISSVLLAIPTIPCGSRTAGLHAVRTIGAAAAA